MTVEIGIDEQTTASAADSPVNALAIVSRELLDSVRNAQLALEDCVDGRGGTAALVRAGKLLHQIRGALLMTETYGAALLVEEMENACQYLATLRDGKGREDGLDALTRAMVQLPLYIERLLSGSRDIALVLLPLLNDLRATRGEPLLSEGTLLLMNLSPSRGAKPEFREGSGEDPILVSRRLRPKFQLALLGWIKGGPNVMRHIEALARVAGALENAANRDDMYQLWRVVGGVLEALRDGGLETSVALKRLLGQADRQIKRTIDDGEAAFDKYPIDDLMNNLLYYVARSTSSGERISEIRAAFNMAEMLPGDEQVEHAREELAAPSVALMKTVASAIKEDLGAVKDVLDIFVRTGMSNPSELVPQLELLKKISDTLGVLGLGELRSDVDSEIDRLKDVIEQGGSNEQVILDVASTLLKVEDQLDRQLMRLTVPQEARGEDSDLPEAHAADFRQVAESVMRECIINLARIKETISQSLTADAPSQGLDAIPSLVRGIKAGLLMLNKTRAMEIVERVGLFIGTMLKAGGPSRLTQKETDRLADAIVSIEYYMETVKAGRAEPGYMLDNAETCLAVLRDTEKRLREEQSQPEAAERSQRVAAVDLVKMAEEIDAAAEAESHKATEVMPLPIVATDAEHIDPELLELFIEEAREEVASIERNLPAWVRAPDDMETLITVRRSFHTLKGSGRMVGAERIGEYCWSVENLLNRLINRTLTRTPPVVQFIEVAAAAIPELIEQLEVGTEPRSDITLYIARANAFAEGDPDAEVLTLERPDEPPAEAVLEMDPVLLDIFRKETAGHLKAITDYVAACAEREAPHAVTDQLYRACHTLHGSANMANVERGVQVAGALNRFVRRVHDNDAGFDSQDISAIEAAAEAIERIVADINQPDVERVDFDELVEQLSDLANAVEPRGTVVDLRDVVDSSEEAPPAEPEPAEPPAPERPAEPEYDAEIAAIFTEESAELLESAEKALSDWSGDRSRRDALEELKRHLHTLKGGARMAGIVSMGDLSHEVETLLGGVEEGRVGASPAVDEALQRAIDELHRMRDRVMAGKAVPSNTDLERRLQAVTGGFDFAPVDSVEESVEASAEAPAQSTEPDAVEAEASQTDVSAEESAESEDLESAVPAAFVIEPEETVSMVIVDSPLEEDEKDDSQDAELTAVYDQSDDDEVVADIQPEPAPDSPVEETPPAEPVAEPRVISRPERTTIAVGPELRATSEKPAAELRSIKRGDSRTEFARIDADLLEDLLNAAGEISIYHSRLNQQVNSFEFHVEELAQTVSRLRSQLRKLEIETEAQIMAGHQDTLVSRDFDPLELDRYSNIQQLSRALAESANDLDSIKDLLSALTTEADSLLVQQSRVTAELQDGLMRTRMVPFERHVSRLTRLVRQAADESGKRAELAVEGASGELDRQVLDKMLPPFEHMLRNAVIHGIENPDERQESGKSPTGRITIRLHREGSEMVIDVADDGRGLDVATIRSKAAELELLKPDADLTDAEIMDLILKPGFSTAGSVTQSAGRGVGMDVVANEVKKLGGSLRISSVLGQGTSFTVRLPFTLAITQALIVRTGDEVYALPLPSVEGVARIPRAELETLLARPEPSFQYGEQTYKFRHLGLYLGGEAARLPDEEAFVPVILVRAGEHSAALLVDEMLASREIVVKSVGPQLAGIRGISGATILGDGSIVLILDINALVRTGAPVVDVKRTAPAETENLPLALVVDDSITVRRVTERFLQRNGMRVVTAKDGLDAISVLGDHRPDVILLDIEMPRMDGYEFASHVRNDDRVADVPIIMITSRVGDKHRARAIEIGVNDYLGKPYQDAQLLDAIRRQLEDRGVTLE
jgi:chemosensory pili system protein ChpA (sensor histidine kinase/response regulator)